MPPSPTAPRPCAESAAKDEPSGARVTRKPTPLDPFNIAEDRGNAPPGGARLLPYRRKGAAMATLIEGLRYFGAIVLLAVAASFGGVALLASELDAGARIVGTAIAIGVAALAYWMWPRSATARSIAPAPMHAAGATSIATPVGPASPSAVQVGTRVIRREVRRRGLFGWLFLVIFMAFNALMALWVIAYWRVLAEGTSGSEWERAGHVIGGTLGTGVLLFLWVCGAVITGLLALLTRGRRTIIEETIQ